MQSQQVFDVWVDLNVIATMKQLTLPKAPEPQPHQKDTV